MADLFELREIHDAYVWQVNAAIGEDRLDLVWQLADDYMNEALRMLTSGEPPTCGSSDCNVCARPRVERPRPRGWARVFRRRRGA